MKKTKTQKGITLVALIITIIVLLILAVVAIRAIQGDNIIAHAENARDEYNEAQGNEQVMLDNYSAKLEGDKSAETIAEAQKDSMLFKIVNSTVTDIYGNKIVVPAGFKILVDNTTGYTKDNLDVTKGIVIQDKDGNEFVWIPIGRINHLDKDGKETTTTIELKRYVFADGTTTYEEGKLAKGAVVNSLSKTEPGDWLRATTSTSSISYSEGLKGSETSNVHAKDIEAFILSTSAEKNGGYYIGRFEAGVSGYDETATNNNTEPNGDVNWTKYKTAKGKDPQLVCKYGQQVWNYVTQKKASDLCRNMYTNKTFESDLINSYAWDTAILFIQTFSAESDASIYSQLNKSTEYKKTGENGDKYCNINDMSGVAKEWSTETCSDRYNPYVFRGGMFYTIISKPLGKTTEHSNGTQFQR